MSAHKPQKTAPLFAARFEEKAAPLLVKLDIGERNAALSRDKFPP